MAVNEEIAAFSKQRGALEASIAAGHFLWTVAEAAGWRRLVRALPAGLRDAALAVLGWAQAQARAPALLPSLIRCSGSG